ncbi:hypothetical protein KFU94_38170 [Chloroflexi bacterium TSY]|nr:hypothetical protein [Chloroflexi bacterium TSY]
MNIISLNSNEARTNWREIIDRAQYQDQIYSVEKYGKSAVFVISADRWNAMQQALANYQWALERERSGKKGKDIDELVATEEVGTGEILEAVHPS